MIAQIGSLGGHLVRAMLFGIAFALLFIAIVAPFRLIKQELTFRATSSEVPLALVRFGFVGGVGMFCLMLALL